MTRFIVGAVAGLLAGWVGVQATDSKSTSGTGETQVRLGNFSVSLTVKDLAASRAVYADAQSFLDDVVAVQAAMVGGLADWFAVTANGLIRQAERPPNDFEQIWWGGGGPPAYFLWRSTTRVAATGGTSIGGSAGTRSITVGRPWVSLAVVTTPGGLLSR